MTEQLSFLDIFPGMELLDPMAALFLGFFKGPPIGGEMTTYSSIPD